MSKVTIIITCYNKAPYIRETIESALSQSFKNFEILIVDDGSTDGSQEIINEYVSSEKIKIQLKENEGVIKTRNKAINDSNSEYIVQLDGDDKLSDNFLELTVPELENNQNVGIVYCQTAFFGDKNGIWDLGKYSLTKQLITNQIVVTALFRKSDFLKTQGYSLAFEKGYEDWDLWLSLIENGKTVKQIEKTGFYYRIIKNSRNHSFSPAIEKKLRSKIFLRHQELYLKNGLDSANLLWEIEKLKSKNVSLMHVQNSLDYRIGSMLLKLPRLIKSIFK